MTSAEAFTGEQYAQGYPPGYERHFWHLARQRLVLDAVRRMTPAGATTLEAGCGLGLYVRLLNVAGYDAWGCEPGQPPVHDDVRSRIWCATRIADLPQELRARVNTVLALDVIEHIGEPVEFLSALRRELPALESLVIAVPARMEIWSNYDVRYGHFRRYDKTLLRHTLAQAGFEIRSMKYAFHATFAAALAIKLSGRSRSEDAPVPAPGIATAIQRLLGRLFYLESLIVPGAVWGSSLLATATRR